MDDQILTFNTEDGVTPIEEVKVLSVVNELHPLMKKEMPEYTNSLPNIRLNKLVKDMQLTMERYNGIGLSANQCGIAVRMFVMGSGESQIVCINPKIIETSVDQERSAEGCLSFPGLYLNIVRPLWILAEFTKPTGETVRTKFTGLTARCYLHELDHMNGKVFTEHVGPVALSQAKQKQSKLLKKIKKFVKNGDKK